VAEARGSACVLVRGVRLGNQTGVSVKPDSGGSVSCKSAAYCSADLAVYAGNDKGGAVGAVTLGGESSPACTCVLGTDVSTSWATVTAGGVLMFTSCAEMSGAGIVILGGAISVSTTGGTGGAAAAASRKCCSSNSSVAAGH